MKKLAYRSITVILSTLAVLLVSAPALVPVAVEAASVSTWWPTNNSHMQGVQPFKAVVNGLDVSAYDMYWQVDGGNLNQMQNSYTDGAHKEASVDLSSWTWHGTGPYAVTFVAKQNGSVIGQTTVSIYNDGAPSTSSSQTASSVTPTTQATQTAAPVIAQPNIVVAAPASINVWWPTANQNLSGVQPFKAVVPSLDVNAYAMYWQVDGGSLNQMQTNMTDGAHKEALVDVSSWNWQTSGTYTLNFVAKNSSGGTIATYSEPIIVHAGATQTSATTSSAPVRTAPATTTTSPTTTTTPSSGLYVNPNSEAAQQAVAWASSNPTGATAMRLLASAPTATWFGDWNSDITSAVSSTVQAASAANKTPVLVAYDIPQRDCGGYSAGGSSNYTNWITNFANGIGNNRAIVVLEPDALAQISCLNNTDQATRLSLLSNAVSILKSKPNTKVYIDAGHSGWIDAQTMANELKQANVAKADGFSLNVSNYDASSNEVSYGSNLSSLLAGKHFVVDTSRNGNGSNGDWCNASGRAIGTLPTTQTGVANLDADLWIKTPGESDGTCNGGPSAGTWWAAYALGLVQNAQH